MHNALPPMRPIPPGTLITRDARRGEERRVELQGFRLAATPVTGESGVPRHGVTWFEAVAFCNDASRAADLTPAYDVDGRRVT